MRSKKEKEVFPESRKSEWNLKPSFQSLTAINTLALLGFPGMLMLGWLPWRPEFSPHGNVLLLGGFLLLAFLHLKARKYLSVRDPEECWRDLRKFEKDLENLRTAKDRRRLGRTQGIRAMGPPTLVLGILVFKSGINLFRTLFLGFLALYAGYGILK